LVCCYSHCPFACYFVHYFLRTRQDDEQGDEWKNNELVFFFFFSSPYSLFYYFLRFKDMEDFVVALNAAIFPSHSLLEMDFVVFLLLKVLLQQQHLH
jgi:hypothetical protein